MRVSEKVLKLEQNEKNKDTRGKKSIAFLNETLCMAVHVCPYW